MSVEFSVSFTDLDSLVAILRSHQHVLELLCAGLSPSDPITSRCWGMLSEASQALVDKLRDEAEPA